MGLDTHHTHPLRAVAMRVWVVAAAVSVCVSAGCQADSADAITPARPSPDPATPADRMALAALSAPLSTLPSSEARVWELLKLLRESQQLSIYVQWDVLRSLDIGLATLVPGARKLAQGKPCHAALASWLDALGTDPPLAFALADGTIIISTPARAAAIARQITGGPWAFLPNESTAGRFRSRLVDNHVREIDFDGLELKDVMQFLHDIGGTGLYAWWSDLNRVGISRNTLITLHLKNVSLHTVWTLTTVEASGVNSPQESMAYAIGTASLCFATRENLRKKEQAAQREHRRLMDD